MLTKPILINSVMLLSLTDKGITGSKIVAEIFYLSANFTFLTTSIKKLQRGSCISDMLNVVNEAKEKLKIVGVTVG